MDKSFHSIKLPRNYLCNLSMSVIGIFFIPLRNFSDGKSVQSVGGFSCQTLTYTLMHVESCTYFLSYCKNNRPGLRSRYSDSLRAGRSGDQIPVGARFSSPVQTGPGAHPALYIMGTGSVPGLMKPGRGVDHLPHLAPRLKKKQSYTSTPPFGPSWSVLG